jgi:hypothetical protein
MENWRLDFEYSKDKYLHMTEFKIEVPKLSA